ncbi:hypothetical protein [Tetragenococcus muriaticus]|nr:hypothetical protein [Tetragenococcus muriaticus]
MSLLEIMTNAKLEQDHTKIQDLFSSDVYQEAVTMSKKVVRNKNYRFKNWKDELKKEEKNKIKSFQEDIKKERDFNDIVSQYLR